VYFGRLYNGLKVAIKVPRAHVPGDEEGRQYLMVSVFPQLDVTAIQPCIGASQGRIFLVKASTPECTGNLWGCTISGRNRPGSPMDGQWYGHGLH
jgi:hypothetical protein